MIGSESQEVERKVISILKVLSESAEPLGARIIAHRLVDHGVELGERAVRYHLKLMDERGLTRLIGRDGRVITDSGVEELKSALLGDKVGYAISKIELLAYRTDFDYVKRTGSIPVNITFFPKNQFGKALKVMKPAFVKGWCASDLVAVAEEGKSLGEIIVPEGRVALATVCSIVINGTLLKAGVPMNSKFGGILQVRNNIPLRFVELIHYSGSSLDPSEVFIRARMTSVANVVLNGNGKVLANYREIPAVCQSMAEKVITQLKQARLDGLLVMGNASEPVCEMPVELNRLGMVLLGGLNPVAAAEEARIEAVSFAMSTTLEYEKLVPFEEVAG